MKAWGKITGVLELWPAGHRSPKHQHGGCAGSVRVLHGTLDVTLYDNIGSKEPIHWVDGDGGLSLPKGEHSTLQLNAGDTTWMNRANFVVHEVRCYASNPKNSNGFALSFALSGVARTNLNSFNKADL